MTLNSTGLGVGVSSAATKFHISGTGTQTAKIQTNTSGDPTLLLEAAGVDNCSILYDRTNGGMRFDVSAITAAMRLSTTGNLGIGVTPSAWGSNYKALQIGAQSCFYNALGYITSINTNAFENSSGQLVRIANGEATRYVQSGGAHQWYYAANANAGFVGGFTQAMTLDASGNLLVGVTSANANGGVLQLKSGITFPAVQVASSDANTLDDYEEGTFTPTIVGTTTAGTGTYTSQTGRYTKIGNQVTVWIYFYWTAHTGTGNMRVSGLPFTILNTAGFYPAASIGILYNIALTAGNTLLAFGNLNSTQILLIQSPTGGGADTDVPIDTAGAISLTMTYTV
jgi:hypothetical protein